MTIATKNGAIIVKDGKLAENCGCCGGWYCDAVACWKCNLTTIYAPCSLTWGSSCVPNIGCKTMIGGTPCVGAAISAVMSGWTAVACVGFVNDDIPAPQIEQFNSTYAMSELCGQVGTTVYLPADPGPFGFTGGTMVLAGGFGQAGSQPTFFNAAPGFVTFQLSVRVLLQYGGFQVSLRYFGAYQSSPISIDSLSSSGDWVRGRSANLVLSETGLAICNLPPQNISIVFQ